ncbi:unnamed protein product [Blepharisma stoltei]|uniref:Ribosomal protein S10 n=1 Tax=Blepharisma stoltei TaxID=1481888 RepID=A0AAU9J7E3_9CILI|nr:unnamed protein product [Blepharisma stoltei]
MAQVFRPNPKRRPRHFPTTRDVGLQISENALENNVITVRVSDKSNRKSEKLLKYNETIKKDLKVKNFDFDLKDSQMHLRNFSKIILSPPHILSPIIKRQNSILLHRSMSIADVNRQAPSQQPEIILSKKRKNYSNFKRKVLKLIFQEDLGPKIRKFKF